MGEPAYCLSTSKAVAVLYCCFLYPLYLCVELCIHCLLFMVVQLKQFVCWLVGLCCVEHSLLDHVITKGVRVCVHVHVRVLASHVCTIFPE